MPITGDELFLIQDPDSAPNGSGIDQDLFRVAIGDVVTYFNTIITTGGGTIAATSIDFTAINQTQLDDILSGLDFTNLSATQSSDILGTVAFTGLTAQQSTDILGTFDYTNLSTTQSDNILNSFDINNLTTAQVTSLMGILDIPQLSTAQFNDVLNGLVFTGLTTTQSSDILSSLDFSGLSVAQQNAIFAGLNFANLTATQSGDIVNALSTADVAVISNQIDLDHLANVDAISNAASVNQILKSDGDGTFSLSSETTVISTSVFTDGTNNSFMRLTLSDATTIDLALSELISTTVGNVLTIDGDDGKLAVTSLAGPVFTSQDSIYVNEGDALSFTPTITNGTAPYTVNIVQGVADYAYFESNANVISYSPVHTSDFESKPNYVIVLQAVDANGISSYQTLKINLVNVNDNVPYFEDAVAGLLSYAIPNLSAGFAFQLKGKDLDNPSSITYTLTGTGSTDFLLNSINGSVSINPATGLTQNLYNLLATVGDGTNLAAVTVAIEVYSIEGEDDDSGTGLSTNTSCSSDLTSCSSSTTCSTDSDMACGNLNCNTCYGNIQSLLYNQLLGGSSRQAPQITGISPSSPAVVDKGGQIVISAVEYAGGSITYTLLNAPVGFTLSGNVINVSSTMPEGPYNFTAMVTDSCGQVAQQNVTVVVGKLNTAPVITAVTPTTLAPGSSSIISVSNLDGDDLTYSLTGAPAGITLDPIVPNQINVAASVDAATYCLTVEVCDPCNLCDSEEVKLTIEGTATNSPPSLIGIGATGTTSATVQLDLANVVSLTVEAFDPDLDVITYGITGGPAGVTIDSLSGNMSFPAATTPGVYSFQVTLTDAAGSTLTTTETITVTVNAANNPPTVAGLVTALGGATPATTIIEGGVVYISASDVDGDTLTYSTTAPVANFTLNSTTGALQALAGSNVNSPYTFDVSATDATGSNTTTTLSVTLAVTSANTAPTLTPLTQTLASVNAGETFSPSYVANDPEGDTLVYEFNNGTTSASGYTIDPTSGDITAPTVLSSTPTDLFVRVEDPSGLESNDITITITQVVDNVAPVITATSILNYASNGVVGGSTTVGNTTIIPNLSTIATDDFTAQGAITYQYQWGSITGSSRSGTFTPIAGETNSTLDLATLDAGAGIPANPLTLQVVAVDAAGNTSSPVIVTEEYVANFGGIPSVPESFSTNTIS